jgi:endonuclease/exonuclease/phosphatase family metal-dependent hydrolase
MRLVTWNLGHRTNGNRHPDRVLKALTALEPDIVILAQRLHDAACGLLLAALADIGLKVQLAPRTGRRNGHVLIASRLELVPGVLEDGANGEHPPRNVLHAYAPTGTLDVLGIRMPDCGSQPTSRDACWDWLLNAAETLKHRRAVLIGDFEFGANHERAGGMDRLRRLTNEGWRHAAPAEGAAYWTTGGQATRLDHAFLSPAIQPIDVRYALEAAGFRLAGTSDSLSEQPALVVDLQ